MKRHVPKTVQVTWSTGGSNELTVDDVIYADRSCGQYENGLIAFHFTNDKVDYFISETGIVYLHGTDTVVGTAPEIKAAADKMERDLDTAYAQGGM
jgi:hypothetical protein